jgi:hypothetical protein
MDLTTLTIIVAAILTVISLIYYILGRMGKITKGIKVAFKCLLAGIICAAYLVKFFETWVSLGHLTFLGGIIYVEVFLLVFSALIFIIGLILDGEQMLAS